MAITSQSHSNHYYHQLSYLDGSFLLATVLLKLALYICCKVLLASSTTSDTSTISSSGSSNSSNSSSSSSSKGSVLSVAHSANYSLPRDFQTLVDTALERADAELFDAVSTTIQKPHNGEWLAIT